MAIFDSFSVPKHVKPSDEGAEKLSDEGAGDAVASRDGSGDGEGRRGMRRLCPCRMITWRATSVCCWRVPSPSISHSVFARRMSSAAPSSCSASSKPSSSAILATSAVSTGEGASASSAPGSTPEVGGRGEAGGGAAGGGGGIRRRRRWRSESPAVHARSTAAVLPSELVVGEGGARQARLARRAVHQRRRDEQPECLQLPASRQLAWRAHRPSRERWTARPPPR
mmetsp:Transcript_7283/g.24052  ORF Transcript_7283/g.24052 Transcript_7283/m.24052 type:complete len:225 (-) Transcript_7283:37-711(-)